MRVGGGKSKGLFYKVKKRNVSFARPRVRSIENQFYFPFPLPNHNTVEYFKTVPLMGDGEDELLWTAAEPFS
jgi:hypothetical protein